MRHTENCGVQLRRGNVHNLRTVDVADGIVCDSHHDALGPDLPLRAKRKKSDTLLVACRIPDEM
jgi:hypothetical protein